MLNQMFKEVGMKVVSWKRFTAFMVLATIVTGFVCHYGIRWYCDLIIRAAGL